MIVVDTSVLVAIVREEPGCHSFEDSLAQNRPSIIGGPTVLETKMVLSRLPASEVDAFFGRLDRQGGLSQVDFTPDMADAAVDAFRRYGKGRGHPAQLNFGDCLSYAVAKVLKAPLLFKGDDFGQTDIEPALAP